MSIDNQLLFCYLEEDNIQQAYFRVRPLLTPDADIRQEAMNQFPVEGCLRIVPDRNEQHTFKSRMRDLGHYCLVDLANLPAEATKIRTNKNFRPDKGEPNQFILYSDTVHELPAHSFYEVISAPADDAAVVAETAITPLFYLRADNVLYGPVCKNDPEKPQKSSGMAGMLFTLPCPDGVERTILCLKDAPTAVRPAPIQRQMRPKPVRFDRPLDAAAVPAAAPSAAAAPADPIAPADPVVPADQTVPADPVVPEAPAAEKPAEKADAADESLPIGETLNILDETKDFEETLQSLNTGVSDSANLLHQQQTRPVKMPPSMMKTGPLTGTPLVRTPLRTSPQPSKNRVQETVSSQWYVGKYEPPAQNLPNGTSMRPIDNPVADAVNAFRAAWRMPEAREQLMDFMLSLDGLRSKLEPRICKDRNITALQRVLRDRLQDLEAERLTALCQLDKARRDMDGFKQEIIAGMANRLQRETGKLESDRDACEAQVASLKTELNSLTVQRDSLLKHIDTLQNDALPATISKLLGDLQLNIPLTGQPLRMSPVSGQQATLDELLARLTAVCGKCGLTLTKNQGIALLLLLAMSDRIGIVSSTPAPAATLIRNIAAAMGWEHSFAHQISAEQRPMVALRPVDATPVLLLTSLPNYAPISGMHKLLLSRSSIGLTRNAAYDAGQWPILPLPALPFIPELPADDAAPISQAALTALLDATSVAKTSDEEITAVLSPIFAMVPPLSGAARAEMYRFIRVAAALMEGGLPVALDFAILLWVVPMVDRTSRNFADFKALLDEYPLSQAKL